MANIVYPLLIFLFTFGAFTTAFNESGLYSHGKIASSGLSTDLNQSSQFNEALQTAASDQNSFSFNSIFLVLKVVGWGIVALFTIYPLIISIVTALMGPPPLAICGFIFAITAPISIVSIYGIIEIVLGRFIE